MHFYTQHLQSAQDNFPSVNFPEVPNDSNCPFQALFIVSFSSTQLTHSFQVIIKSGSSEKPNIISRDSASSTVVNIKGHNTEPRCNST